MRCLMSRKEEASSKMYTSASLAATAQMAKRCSSPPDSCWISLCIRWSIVSALVRCLSAPLSSHFSKISPTTLPLANLDTKSTSSCTLVTTLKSSSSSLVRYACRSLPRWYVTMSCHEGGSLKLPRLGLSLPAKIFSAVDLPIPLLPRRPRT
mmetsp:Transcript_36765/g.79588  ORF Transcript_36765/g.79588 Transcript_36765/m.79588 type:complete len:152 (+) Transcript_36765:1317-1772(+)